MSNTRWASGKGGPTFHRALLAGMVAALLAVLVGLAQALGADARPEASPTQVRAPGHFKCYEVEPSSLRRTVVLVDQFERKRTIVLSLTLLCNPVQKNREGIAEPRAHLVCYRIQDAGGQPPFRPRVVAVTNQFGTEVVTVERPRTLCVPSLKRPGSSPPPEQPAPSTLLDNFKCYDIASRTSFAPRTVSLTDQFEAKRTRVLGPETLCNPVRKDDEPIRQPLGHLKCYAIRDAEGEPGFARRTVTVRNQFGVDTLAVVRPQTLCLPSLKRTVPTPRFGATCKPKLTIPHGGQGVFRIVPVAGSAPILSTVLAQAQPANTPSYRITKNAAPANSFTFRSKKVDPPPRTVLYIVRIRVRFGTPGNVVASVIVKCEVRVVHDVAKLLLGIAGDPARFKTQTGQESAVRHAFLGWEQGFRWGTKLARLLEQLAPIPMIHLGTRLRSGRTITPLGIGQGRGDDYLVALNQGIAALGGRVYVRPMAEMNNFKKLYAAFRSDGSSRGAAYSPAAYRKAFARISIILHGGTRDEVQTELLSLELKGIGPSVQLATNPPNRLRVIWNPQGASRPNIRQNFFDVFYPGDAFVDVVGNDIFDVRSRPQNETLYAFSRRHRKPFSLPEWGLEGVDDPALVQYLCDFIRSRAGIELAAYFESRRGSRFDLADKPRARQTYRRCLTPLGA